MKLQREIERIIAAAKLKKGEYLEVKIVISAEIGYSTLYQFLWQDSGGKQFETGWWDTIGRAMFDFETKKLK